MIARSTFFAALILGLASSAAASAAPTLDGVWLLDAGQAPAFAFPASDPPPFTSKAKAVFDQRQKALAAGDAQIDPTAKCMPMGFPRDMSARFPIQIVTDPQKISMIFPSSIRVRRIFMDRTVHDPDIDPQFNGDSIGHWDGAALVIDTTGFMPDLWLDGTGAPQSPDAHVAETITLSADGRTLTDRITVDSPADLTRPWTTTKTYSRKSSAVLTDGLCEELSVGHPDWARRLK